MLYGRRSITPQGVPHGTRQRSFIVSKSFQYKYCWYMITAVAGGAILFLLPSFYFVTQNYELFKNLAFDTHPSLVSHLEREVIWIRIFLGASFIFLTGVTLFLSIRMTKNLLSPLVRMEKHMHQLMLGRWNIPEYKVSDEDDFRDLSLTYDYFYRALRSNTEADLKLLEKLSIDPQNREAYAAWKNLLSEKRARLGIEEEFISSESVAETNVFDLKRRAS